MLRRGVKIDVRVRATMMLAKYLQAFGVLALRDFRKIGKVEQRKIDGLAIKILKRGRQINNPHKGFREVTKRK